MTKLKMILGITAALSVGALAAPADSAPPVIEAISGGPFSGTNPIGAFPVIALFQANTYDFTFELVPPLGGATSTQLQAQADNSAQLIQFDLFSGTPTGPHTPIATSPLATSSLLSEVLGPGDYFVQVTNIAVNGEVESGSLITASVPEPATWALMILGAGAIGGALRGRRRLAAA
jgi:hypothetical protein